MFRFLTSKPLWVNILAGFIFLVVLLLLFLGSLDIITHHGKTMKIPTVVGQSIDQARKTLESQGFEIQIQDSIYNDTIPPLQVIKQFPEADNLVKVNRTVYLTINRAVAPEVDMPNLLSMTFRNAEMVLRRYGLKLGDTLFKPDFARNSVLDQQYKGESIKPGTKIQQGSEITLVLGNGVGIEFIVPDLFGLTCRDARAAISEAGLLVGSVVPDVDVKDTMNAYVYRQNPDRYDYEKKVNHIRQGQIMDIWVSVLKKERIVDSSAVQKVN
ncbi:MAG TPA: PASTA domain-containing protein [Puia sp.]|nr:PASTA domain-containing protein [Puia sp.]